MERKEKGNQQQFNDPSAVQVGEISFFFPRVMMNNY